MAIEWATAAKYAAQAFQAFMAYLQGSQDASQREQDRDLILAAIDGAREEILDRLDLLEVNELRGELEGFSLIYASYDPNSNDPLEEERLVSLIDDSARVLGRLGADLDTIGNDPDLALEAWAIYVPLLYLRAQAMAERQARYGADETKDALLSIDMALPRLAGLLSYLRMQSDRRVGPVVCRPIPDSEDSRVCWYYVEAGQFICGSLSDPRGIEKCQQSRAAMMDNLFGAFPGVREITAAARQLQNARDALDTIGALNILARKGIDIGEVSIVHGRLARSPSKRSIADTAKKQDWFS